MHGSPLKIISAPVEYIYVIECNIRLGKHRQKHSSKYLPTMSNTENSKINFMYIVLSKYFVRSISVVVGWVTFATASFQNGGCQHFQQNHESELVVAMEALF